MHVHNECTSLHQLSLRRLHGVMLSYNGCTNWINHSQCTSGWQRLCWTVLSHTSSLSRYGSQVLSGLEFHKPTKWRWCNDNCDYHESKLVFFVRYQDYIFLFNICFTFIVSCNIILASHENKLVFCSKFQNMLVLCFKKLICFVCVLSCCWYIA